MKALRKIGGLWKDLGTSERLSLVTFTLCVIAGGLGFAGRISVGVPSITLMLLGVLALAFLLDQRGNRHFHVKVTSLLHYDRLGKATFFSLGDLPNFENRILSATEVWISGLTLNTFLATNNNATKRFLERGGTLKILLAPTSGEVVERSNRYLPFENESFGSQRDASVSRIRAFEREFRTQVKWRELSLLPNHFILIIDPKRSGGEAQLHMYFYRIHTDDGRLLIIHEGADAENFKNICNEFEHLWTDAKATQ